MGQKIYIKKKTIILQTYISDFYEAILSLIFIHIIIKHKKFSGISFDITSHIHAGHMLPLHQLLQFVCFYMLKITNMAATQTFVGAQCMITFTAYICTSGNK